MEKITDPTPPPRGNDQNRGVVMTSQPKEEPPDTQQQIHSTRNNEIAQGKSLHSHLYRCTNLPSLGADCIISRSKFFQEGGNDEVQRTKVGHDEEKMHPGEDINTHVKEGTIANDSIVYVEIYKTITTSDRDCSVRTAGFDPDPIGDSGTFLVVGKVTHMLLSIHTPSNHPGDEYSSANSPRSSSTQPNELLFNIRPTITYLEDLGQARIHPDRARIKDGHDTSSGTKNRSEARSSSSFTQVQSLGSSFHHQMIYLGGLGRIKPSPDRAKSGDRPWSLIQLQTERSNLSYLPYMDWLDFLSFLHLLETLQTIQRLPKTCTNLPKLTRYKPSSTCLIWSDFTNAPNSAKTDRVKSSGGINQMEVHALMFCPTPKKTTRCFKGAKTTQDTETTHRSKRRNKLTIFGTKEDQLTTALSFIFTGYFKDHLLSLDIPRIHQFPPKLSRLKDIHICLIWTDCASISPTALLSIFS